MAYIDFEYYNQVCRGRCSKESFEELSGAAEAIVSALCTSGAIPEDLNVTQSALVRCAIAQELDYLYMQGGVAALSGAAEFSIEQLNLGDCQLNVSETGVRHINGIPIAPLLSFYLEKAGLRSRWV